MQILAICGSLRAGSSNTALLRATAALAPKNVHITIYEGLADLPYFDPNIDPDDSPAPVRDLRVRLRAADGVLISTPEYAYGIPGILKNALDWTVGTGEFTGKPVAAISASPSYMGGDKAHAALLLTLTALAAEIVEEASLSIPYIRTKLNANGDVSDPATAQALQAAINALVRAIAAHS